MEAHCHLAQLVTAWRIGMSFKRDQGVRELDVCKEMVRLEVPADGGFEVGQFVWVRVEQALELVCPHGASGGTGPDLVGTRPVGVRERCCDGARPTGVRGRREDGGGAAEAVFFNGPEPRVVADCLIGVGGGPAAAVFFNGPEVRAHTSCLLVVTHPSVKRGSAGWVRGTGGPWRRGWVAAEGPVTRLLAARVAAALLAGHPEGATVEGGGGGEGGIADAPEPVTARSLLAGEGGGRGHGERKQPGRSLRSSWRLPQPSH